MVETSRRSVLFMGAGSLTAAAVAGVAGTAGTAQAAGAVPTAPSARARTRLVLLGTSGGPPPMTGRSGISSAIAVGDATYLVDLGHGTFGQFHKSGLPPTSLRGVFLTHLHSDHLAEAYTLPWLRFGGVRSLTGPIQVYGPGRAGALPESRSGEVPTLFPDNPTPGTADFFESSMRASAYDLNIRMRDEGWPDIRSVLDVQDISIPEDVGASAPDNLFPDMEPFVVHEDDRVRVTATLVEHPPVFPSFGFRFDTDNGSVVFSGDTSVSENLIRLAEGADYLVHEVINLDWLEGNVPEELIAHLAESHTDVDLIGGLAERAGVRNLVLSHLVPGDPREVSEGEWRSRARKGFSGRVFVGRDLMEFRLH